MIRLIAALAPLAIAGCTYGSGGPPPLPPLAENRNQPAAALAEHVLSDHFARQAGNADVPTTCISVAAPALNARQEQALIARFPRLAPLERCQGSGGNSDAITGERAEVLRIEAFSCSNGDTCSGWVATPDGANARYVMRWGIGGWRFVRDTEPGAR